MYSGENSNWNYVKAEQSRAKFKKRGEKRKKRRMSHWRYDIQKNDYLINTHFQFNEYSWLTIALSGSTDEDKEIKRLLLFHRVFLLAQFRARSLNSLIVISDFSFSFVNSKRWCKFFACDILVSTVIRIAQAAFK